MLNFFYTLCLLISLESFAGDTRKNKDYEISFNYPDISKAGPAVSDNELQGRIVQMLRTVPSGSSVHATTRAVNHPRIASELVKSYKRGVEVRVVMAGNNYFKEWEILKKGLGKNLTICGTPKKQRGCIGEGKNHNKFFLFSQLADGTRNVVLQTSANLGRASKFQNHIIFKNHKDLYEGYLRYWKDLNNRVRNDNYYKLVKDQKDGVLAHFMPRTDGKDSYKNNLSQVACRSEGKYYIAMAYFMDSRVFKMLENKAKSGCQVNIIVRDDVRNRALFNWYKKSTISRLRLWKLENLHSKYSLVRGKYLKVKRARKVVFTGSYNFTRSALEKNDEAFVRVIDDFVYDSYYQNWTRLKNLATRVKQNRSKISSPMIDR